MGVCDSDSINNNKIKNEKSDLRGVMDDEITMEYIQKAKYSTCYIKNKENNITGSGFFCRIPYTEDKNNFINVLITCEHVLEKDIVFSDESITVIVNNEEKNIPLKKERKRWSNKDLDFSCIEILNEDNIEDFYLLDDIFTKNYTNDKYINKNIIIFCMMNKKRGHCDGLIKKINDCLFIHNCNTFPGSSGGVIINKNNGLVVGLHKGELKNDKNKNCNVGIFIKDIIEQIISNKQKNLEYKIQNHQKFPNFPEEEGRLNEIPTLYRCDSTTDGFFHTLSKRKYY